MPGALKLFSAGDPHSIVVIKNLGNPQEILQPLNCENTLQQPLIYIFNLIFAIFSKMKSLATLFTDLAPLKGSRHLFDNP